MTLKESSDESTVVYVPRTNILALNPADPGLTGEMLHTLRDHVPHAVGAQTAGHERVCEGGGRGALLGLVGE